MPQLVDITPAAVTENLYAVFAADASVAIKYSDVLGLGRSNKIDLSERRYIDENGDP